MLITDQITPHFSARELAGRSGIPSDPDVSKNLIRLATTLLEPGREEWAKHITEDNLGGSPAWTVIDAYRSDAVNTEVGGASQSQHPRGCAADVACDVDWRALRDGRGTDRDARRMQDFATWITKWVYRGDACGGIGIYTELHTGQLYWVHIDIRPRVNGHVATWTGHHVGSEQ